MTRNRVVIYISVFVLFVAAIFIKVQIIKKKSGEKVVSIDSEWKEHGVSVNVYKIAKRDMGSFRKISGILKTKRHVSATATYALRHQLQLGLSVKATLENGEEVAGVVSKISNKVDIDSGLYNVEIDFKKNLNAEIGSIVVSNIKVSSLSKIIKIPLDSIVEESGKKYCWIVKDKKAIKKEVVLGKKNGTFFEVLKGLKLNDLVVTDGKTGLKENALVRIYKTIGEMK
jgi:hypothetical protein